MSVQLQHTEHTTTARKPILQSGRHKHQTGGEEMKRVFNLGIGYCVVVSNSEVDNTQSIIERNGLRSWVIGKINT